MNKYKRLLQYKDFRKNVIAGVLYSFGDSFDSLSISLLIYAITGSSFWFAINFAINALPNLIIQPFAGALVEKMDRKKIIVSADLFRSAMVLLLIVLNMYTTLSPWIVLLITFLITSFEAFSIPAGMVMTPSLVSKEDYSSALSLKSSLNLFSGVVASALAGVIITLFSINTALLIDSICFLLSGLLIYSIKTKLIESDSKGESYINNLKAGLQYFKRHEFLLIFAQFAFVITILFAGFNIIITPYFLEDLTFNPAQISLFSSCILITMMLGSITYPIFEQYLNGKIIFSISTILAGVTLAILPLSTSYLYVYLIALVFGFIQGTFSSAMNTLFISSVEESYLSRAGALFNSFSYAASPIGSLIVSMFMLNLSYKMIFISYGIVMIIISVVFYYFIRKSDLNEKIQVEF